MKTTASWLLKRAEPRRRVQRCKLLKLIPSKRYLYAREVRFLALFRSTYIIQHTFQQIGEERG